MRKIKEMEKVFSNIRRYVNSSEGVNNIWRYLELKPINMGSKDPIHWIRGMYNFERKNAW
jgi:predicted dithiol-disulfide oxidoreductase (DUF899 family)